MRIIDFWQDEAGAITVDWAMLSVGAVMMALVGAAGLTSATQAFTDYNASELALQNAGGQSLLKTDGYVPESDVLYEGYLAGLQKLNLDELDTVAALANRLYASGYGRSLGGGTSQDPAQGACNADVGAGYGVGYCEGLGLGNQNRGGNSGKGKGNGNGGKASDQMDASVNDFLVAVDKAYTLRGEGRPTHTRINTYEIRAAFAAMGLSDREIAALMPV